MQLAILMQSVFYRGMSGKRLQCNAQSCTGGGWFLVDWFFFYVYTHMRKPPINGIHTSLGVHAQVHVHACPVLFREVWNLIGEEKRWMSFPRYVREILSSFSHFGKWNFHFSDVMEGDSSTRFCGWVWLGSKWRRVLVLWFGCGGEI